MTDKSCQDQQCSSNYCTAFNLARLIAVSRYLCTSLYKHIYIVARPVELTTGGGEAICIPVLAKNSGSGPRMTCVSGCRPASLGVNANAVSKVQQIQDLPPFACAVAVNMQINAWIQPSAITCPHEKCDRALSRVLHSAYCVLCAASLAYIIQCKPLGCVLLFV